MIKYSVVLIFLSLIIYSCSDDSGVTASQNKGSLYLSSLKQLDKNIEGTYELWASVETGFDHDENAFRSLGRFAVNSFGELTDTSGGTFNVNLSKIANINNIGDVIITIQPPGYNDTIPSNIKLLGGSKYIQGSELIFDLSMSYTDILPVSSQFSTAQAKYLLASPTTGLASSQYLKGIWFTRDTNGTTEGLTLPVLPDTAEWTYQAWVYDGSDNYYNIGRFDSPSERDGNQQCELAGGLVWQLPGQDWLQANCPGGGLPDIISLNNSYKILITLEPKYEQGIALGKPFYLKIFEGNITVQPFGTVQNITNYFDSFMPSAQLRLSGN
jgi:hypothetical protein